MIISFYIIITRKGIGKTDAVLLKEYAAVVRDLRTGISICKTAKIHNLSPITITVQKVKAAAGLD